MHHLVCFDGHACFFESRNHLAVVFLKKGEKLTTDKQFRVGFFFLFHPVMKMIKAVMVPLITSHDMVVHHDTARW